MKTYIVATDFSEEAENAIEYAGALARETGARLILFNSFSLPVHTANSLLTAEAIYKIEENNKKLLEERAQRLAETYNIEVGIKSGLFLLIEDGLAELFEQTGAALVVMGMAARSVEQDIFGNTTTSVILKLKYPVLAVPKSAKFTGVKQILFACEALEKVEPEILEKIMELARQLQARVEVFHVENRVEAGQAPEPVQQGIKEFEAIDYSWKNYRADSVVKAIGEEIRNIDAHLLIMIPQHYGFWESMVHRSKTKMMASGLSIPLLSIPQ